MKLDLGCGRDRNEGYVGVDKWDIEGVGVVCDLEKFPWPWDDNSIEAVRASHILEHLPDALKTMDEIFRILIPGGTLEIDVPSTSGPGAFQDPGHKSFWNLNSFIYYDKRIPLGDCYGCNKWDIMSAFEYNTTTVVRYGPYVKAVLRKPDNGSVVRSNRSEILLPTEY